MKIKKENLIIGILVIISIILAVVTNAYLVILNNLSTDKGNLITFVLKNISITKCAITFLAYVCISILFYKKGNEIGNFLYKYRFIIAIVIFILCVVFEISGSSVGMWRYCIGSDLENSGDILGTARAIRGDEWVVNTPFAISQEQNQPENYTYISNTIRGDKTDVFIVYGQPVKDISMIFRPFQLGYLLFGSAKGLSFFWCGRIIALFLVSFELGMLITKNRKDISLIAAILITLAPSVQWWFAVNGFVEMIVFGGLAILLLQKYMTTDNFWKRLLYLTIIGICGGGYILVFYPAWQLPMAYIFLGLAIWVIIENRKQCKIKLKDILSIICIVLIILMLLLNIYMKSKDTISLVMNTAYPGARCETGGGYWGKYFNYPSNLFFTLDDQDLGTNVCEGAVFFDLFPVGFILALIVIFKEKNKDVLLIILLTISAIFAIWCAFGLPKILAKLTLLYLSPAKRTFVAVGFLNILVLIRSMSLIKEPINKKISIIMSVILMIIVTTICVHNFPDYYGVSKIVITMFALTILYFLTFNYNDEKTKKLLIPALIIVIMFMSFLINPIRKGLKVITDQPVGKEIQKIQSQESGLWIVEGAGYPLFNFPIMYGAPTINSTNVYPNLDRWKLLDPDGKYEDIYNRYAHITVELVSDKESKFELTVQDAFKLYLPVDKLKDLNVKYIFTVNDLEDYENEDIKFEKLYDEYGVRIYKII